MKRVTMSRRKGIAYVEILALFIIIIFLSVLIPPSHCGVSTYVNGEHKRSTAAMQIGGIRTALDAYYGDNGYYPTTEQGLEALVTKPTTDPLPKKYREGGYMKRVPIDPWGKPYIYRRHGEEGPIEIYSSGWNEEEGTMGDIMNHNKVP